MGGMPTVTVFVSSDALRRSNYCRNSPAATARAICDDWLCDAIDDVPIEAPRVLRAASKERADGCEITLAGDTHQVLLDKLSSMRELNILPEFTCQDAAPPAPARLPGRLQGPSP